MKKLWLLLAGVLLSTSKIDETKNIPDYIINRVNIPNYGLCTMELYSPKKEEYVTSSHALKGCSLRSQFFASQKTGLP